MAAIALVAPDDGAAPAQIFPTGQRLLVYYMTDRMYHERTLLVPMNLPTYYIVTPSTPPLSSLRPLDVLRTLPRHVLRNRC